MRYPILIAAACALAACGSEKSGTFETEDGETGEYSVDADDGGATATITTDDGTASFQSGPGVKAKLPDGFTIFPGAKTLSSTNITNDDGVGTMVTLQAEADPDQFASFYRNQAERAGIEIEMEMTINDGKMLAGKGENGKSFSLMATPDEEGGTTTAQLMVSEGLID